VIYGFINYDNQAGLEQPYLITEEITIDYMQFVQPAELTETAFKLEWQKADHESVFETEIPLRADRYPSLYPEPSRLSSAPTRRSCTRGWWAT
jgi:hypothetical protein